METCATCGHAKAEHYAYVANDKPARRCRKCDPRNTPAPAGITWASADQAADHEFAEKAQ